MNQLATRGLVVVCGESTAARAIGRAAVANKRWNVRVVENLCKSPESVLSLWPDESIDRLVFALCLGGYSKSDFAEIVRKTGVQVFSSLIVDIPTATAGKANKAAVVSEVKSAISRLEAQPEALIQNIRRGVESPPGVPSGEVIQPASTVRYRALPTVNMSLCRANDGCDSCERACPHNAIHFDRNVLQISEVDCRSCGICVGVCPERAVELPGYSTAEIESQVKTLLADTETTKVNILFACSNSSPLPIYDWQIVQVACSAMTPAKALTASVEHGAHTTGILQCVDKCPQWEQNLIDSRLELARAELSRVGEVPGRIVKLSPANSGDPLKPSRVRPSKRRLTKDLRLFGSIDSSN
jgi:ferredoxin